MNKFILMVGVPGSGKSTYAERITENERGTVISSDTLLRCKGLGPDCSQIPAGPVHR